MDLYLDRPAVVPEIAEKAAALLCSYGSSVDAFFGVLLGHARPKRKLPFDLPSSMEAVRQSNEDMSFDTKDPGVSIWRWVELPLITEQTIFCTSKLPTYKSTVMQQKVSMKRNWRDRS